MAARTMLSLRRPYLPWRHRAIDQRMRDECLDSTQASEFKLVGKADFHMSAEMDVCIGTELYIRTPGVGIPLTDQPKGDA